MNAADKRREHRRDAVTTLARIVKIGKRRTARESKCMIWQFRRDSRGYAVLSTQSASRMICERVYGHAPEDRPWALHDCDNGAGGCIEPSHLAWGSPRKNNVEDRRRDGTFYCGEQSPASKLTEADVVLIRKAFEVGMSKSRLARAFEVTPSTIGDIIRGVTWKEATTGVHRGDLQPTLNAA